MPSKRNKNCIFGLSCGSPEVPVVHSTILILLLSQVMHFQVCQSTLLREFHSNRLSKSSDLLQNKYFVLQSDLMMPQSSSNSLQQVINPATASRLNSAGFDEDEDSFETSQISPLVTAWHQSISSKSNSNLNSKYLMKSSNIIEENNKSSLNSSSSSSKDINDLIDYSKVPGEPNVVESVSTEFPNPNINNLGHEITKILKKFFLHGYDKRVRPNYSGPPALVNVSFHIIGISSVDEVQMDFTTDFYFRQKWFDPRLEFNPVGNIDELCVGAEFAEKIWLPDTFFANEKTATFHRATTENTFIRIAHTGRVYRSIRLTVTCSCPMDLQYFPMDRQRCKIEIESYGYNTRDIDYRWERGDDSVTLNTKIELPQFKILGFKMGQELQNLSSGDYIRLYCEIHFVRSMGYYLIQIYIPASLIVMISWVSFWLHRNATPARVALGVTTVLTMTTLMSSTNAALPKISYIKSIDVFLGYCFVMVFASLLEYASVGYIGKRIAMKRKRLQDLQQMQQHHQRICIAAAASAAATFNNNINQQTNKVNEQQTQSNEDSLVVLQLQQQTPLLDNRTNNSVTNDHRLTAIDHQWLSEDQNRDRIRKSANQRHDDECRQVRNVETNDQDTPKPIITTTDTTTANTTSTSTTNTITTNTSTGNKNKYTIGNNTNGKRGKPRSKQMKSNPINPTDYLKTPLLTQNIPPTSNNTYTTFSQPSHGATTEFEATTTHDMVRICGITPSAIDKHSRVVFPICFVCFNLMYWIIYGHISQQVEDKGPPMIPFIKG